MSTLASSYSPARYDIVAIAFHWLSAALIVTVGTIGLLIDDDLPRSTFLYLLNLHGCFGLAYLVLVALRIVWRLGHRPPNLPEDAGEISRRLSPPVHLLLYVLMLAVPLMGLVAFIWHGRVFDYGAFSINFGIASTRAIFKPAEEIHELLAYALFGLAGLHTLAAVWHTAVLKDGGLKRILPFGN